MWKQFVSIVLGIAGASALVALGFQIGRDKAAVEVAQLRERLEEVSGRSYEHSNGGIFSREEVGAAHLALFRIMNSYVCLERVRQGATGSHQETASSLLREAQDLATRSRILADTSQLELARRQLAVPEPIDTVQRALDVTMENWVGRPGIGCDSRQ